MVTLYRHQPLIGGMVRYQEHPLNGMIRKVADLRASAHKLLFFDHVGYVHWRDGRRGGAMRVEIKPRRQMTFEEVRILAVAMGLPEEVINKEGRFFVDRELNVYNVSLLSY